MSKRAELPTTVKIGPHFVPVRVGPSTSENFGEYVYDPATIVIREGMSATITAEVLLHEILHSLWDGAQMRRLCEGAEDSALLEETLITVLSPLLLQVLRDNPEVVKVLLK